MIPMPLMTHCRPEQSPICLRFGNRCINKVLYHRTLYINEWTESHACKLQEVDHEYYKQRFLKGSMKWSKLRLFLQTRVTNLKLVTMSRHVTITWRIDTEKSIFNLMSRAQPAKTSAAIFCYIVTSLREHKQSAHNGGQWAWIDLGQEL